jgi:UDP-N-acetylglucosamine acyltransferase
MNNIHHTAIIGENVVLGDNNVILPYTLIDGPTEIGSDNIIGPHVVIGSPGQDTRHKYYDSSNSFIKIGNRNIIREFSAIQKPCYQDITSLGDDIFIMQSVHIPHDAQLMNNVVITPMCVLAGMTRILEGANLGMGSTINQYCVVGQYSIVATGAAAMKNVKPFSKFIPRMALSVNSYAVEKNGYSDYVDEISRYVLEDKLPTSDMILKIVEEFESHVRHSGRQNY